MKTRIIKGETARRLQGDLFILPWFVGFLMFVAFPLFFSLYMSFHDVTIKLGHLETSYAGFKYYRRILFENQGLLYEQLFPFLRQALIMIPIIVVFAMMLAIMLNQKFFGRTFFRVVFFLPVIFTTGAIISSLIGQGEGGLNFLGEYDVTGLVTENLPNAWASPIVNILEQFVLILWYSGVQMLIFLAGRQTISSSIYEAALIDGASPWETFWKITFPAMIPFNFLNIIYTVVDLFTFPTNPILNQLDASQYGFSSALAWIYSTIIFIFLGLVILVFSRVNRTPKGGRI